MCWREKSAEVSTMCVPQAVNEQAEIANVAPAMQITSWYAVPRRAIIASAVDIAPKMHAETNTPCASLVEWLP